FIQYLGVLGDYKGSPLLSSYSDILLASYKWSCLIIAFQVLKLKAIQVTVPLPRDQLPPCLKSPILVVGCISTSTFSSSIDCNKIPGLEGLHSHLF
ncbi:unnamed protein product, partial [Musa acuminata var. zebrina]